MGWIATVRSILELLYFLSGIAIAVVAFFGLRQIKLTKQIAKANLRREAVKLASDLCADYAETVVPLWTKANEEYTRQGLKCLAIAPPAGQPPFFIRDGEILNHHFNVKQLAADTPKFPSAITFLNSLEAFAIPFAAGVADEDIGYRETARPFCQSAVAYMPAIFQLRTTNAGRFESIVVLYEIWSKRLAVEVAAPAMRAMQELSKDAAKSRIKPFDPGF